MWGRGLKHHNVVLAFQECVAPHVGAWIETEEYLALRRSEMSPPMWGRGLKQLWFFENCFHKFVAPHVGAWIETSQGARNAAMVESPPMWGRGLKPLMQNLR